MKISIITVLSALLIWSLGDGRPENQDTKETCYETTTEGASPYLAAIHKYSSDGCCPICTATIIAPNAVLTTNNCLFDQNVDNLRIVAGASTIPEKQQVRSVENIFLHQDSDGVNVNNLYNAAIIIVSEPFQFNEHVAYAFVEIEIEGNYDGFICKYFGWNFPKYSDSVCAPKTSEEYVESTAKFIGARECHSVHQSHPEEFDLIRDCFTEKTTQKHPFAAGGPLMCDDFLLGLAIKPNVTSDGAHAELPLFIHSYEFSGWINQVLGYAA